MAENLLLNTQTIVSVQNSHKSSNFILNTTKPFAMNPKILLLALVAATVTSCTTAYKSGQTPDDVYYSPARPQEEYVQRQDREDDRYYRNNEDEYLDDRYLRMKVRNRDRWSDLDDPYYYNYYRYSTFNCGCFNNPWTPSVYWNSYFNPYYHGMILVNPGNIATTTKYSGPRTFNLNTFNNTAITNGNYSNPKYLGGNNNPAYNPGNNNSPRYSSPTRSSNSGNILRDIFGGNNNSKSSGSSSSPSSSSSSSSSGGSAPASAPVRRF